MNGHMFHTEPAPCQRALLAGHCRLGNGWLTSAVLMHKYTPREASISGSELRIYAHGGAHDAPLNMKPSSVCTRLRKWKAKSAWGKSGSIPPPGCVHSGRRYASIIHSLFTSCISTSVILHVVTASYTVPNTTTCCTAGRPRRTIRSHPQRREQTPARPLQRHPPKAGTETRSNVQCKNRSFTRPRYTSYRFR